ncbi:ribonuclease D [Marinobacter sp. UBA3607]|jgi:ribonuclease D|uniref:ribonuclease D n=1 Tax=Marinobacter sp. UBA3607 TaxID=1946820 RepID=UPI000E9A1907|nr:HRDC domain-containing protein [Marinobacter sp. UBA3607]HBM49534.1 ribonuclease D [Marinobacter sp.]|tara:strand:- start:1328 stop:2479 length:1152 start_codon:yes stop_codon:yes gene_type:complete
MTDSPLAAPVPPAPETVRWLSNPAELDQWLEQLAPGAPVALDTEFERVSTFYPIPGLVQLGGQGEYWLIDPDVAEGSAGFRTMLADPARPKLLYAMSEDLELFRHWLNVAPAGLLDLQIGAAMAGAGFSLGYAKLVETLFGEVLDKSVTRSDWVSRPLSPEQQRYAIDDIRFLEPLYNWVIEKLQQRNLKQALAEESQRFADEAAGQEDPEQHYLKLRGGWALTREQQAVLRLLVAWRERECQKVDRPRNRVLNDGLLIAIAERLPGSLRTLNDIQGVPGGIVKRYGEHLLELVREGREADNANLEPIPRPLSRDQQAVYKKVKRCFNKVAEDLDIPIELLAPRKRIEKVLQDGTLAGNEFFQGWRGELLKPVETDIEELLRP